MRSIPRITIFALAAAAVAAPAAAASDYFLHLDDVKGGSAAKAGGGTQLEILSWSWGATNSGGGSGGTGKVSMQDMNVTTNVASPGDPATGMPTEKRQHGWMPSNRPLDRGSVRVKVKFPWLDCKVGAAFPDAVLQNDSGRYELKDVMISSCAADNVGLDYAKLRESPSRPSQK